MIDIPITHTLQVVPPLAHVDVASAVGESALAMLLAILPGSNIAGAKGDKFSLKSKKTECYF
jgi:hypothetical protein